ncbi:MAG: DUF192 domain-containing protein [Patescibacteria group bacterium]
MDYLKNKKIILLAVVLLLIFLISIFFFTARPAAAPLQAIVEINSRIIDVEIASTPRESYRGLSGREALCPDCGMLFVFPDKKERGFVMREMNFPLDIIFIADGQIIKIAENCPPAGKNPDEVYRSGAPADQVLEVNGGYADKYYFKVGDEVRVKEK